MSAQKYYLVEQNKYDSIFSNYDPDHIKIAQKDLRDILNNNKLDTSSKNVLYNNALINFNKKMKQANEKPVKVEDTKLADANINLDSTLQNLATLLSSNISKKRKKEKKIQEKNDAKENVQVTPQTNTPLNVSNDFTTPQSTPPMLEPESPLKTPKRKNVRGTPATIRRQRQRATIKDNIDKKTKNLKKYMLNNPLYGFTKDGVLISPTSKKLVKDSNVERIARYAVNSVGLRTPAGFKKIQKQINLDKYAREYKSNPNAKFTVQDWGKN